jgi:RNA polymerase sigma-70 factor (ECF subfamily)
MHCDMDHVSDFEMMERIRNGDRDAFNLLVERYRESLAAFFRRLGARHEAEDLVQETFLRVFRHRARYSPTAKFSTFLYTIARNVWTDRWRKWARWRTFREELEEERRTTPLARPYATSTGARLDIQAALAALPEKLRIVVILSIYQGLSYPEISAILKIPVGTVKSRVFHALTRLKEFFDEDAPPT